jgi:nucleoside 2-deoxyribosyltransferase
MKQPTVYLSGHMECLPKKKTLTWRNKAARQFEEAGWKVRDPTLVPRKPRGEERRSDLHKIFRTDLANIHASDVVLVNLNHYTTAAYGTAMEIFYAAFNHSIPVVIFSKHLIWHPFLTSLAEEIFPNQKDAVSFIIHNCNPHKDRIRRA